MVKKRTTIKTLAEALGLSTSTVSRALSGHADVSLSTKEKVQQLAVELNYFPDPVAVSLKSGQTRVIGGIVPQLVNLFFSKALDGIQQIANANNYNILIAQSRESVELEKQNVEAMLARNVDGLIVSISKETVATDHFSSILKSSIPIIFFDRIPEDIHSSRVVIDDYEASYRAVEHLIKQGCKRIAHTAGPPNLFNSRKRLEGYKNALRDNGLVLDKRLIVFYSYQPGQVFNDVRYLLNLKDSPDGIFAVNDVAAMEMIHHIKTEGLHIPQDIAVVGFNNDPTGEFTEPPLSTVNSPALELGKEAAGLLLAHINDDSLATESKTIKSELIIRQSSLKRFAQRA